MQTDLPSVVAAKPAVGMRRSSTGCATAEGQPRYTGFALGLAQVLIAWVVRVIPRAAVREEALTSGVVSEQHVGAGRRGREGFRAIDPGKSGIPGGGAGDGPAKRAVRHDRWTTSPRGRVPLQQLTPRKGS